MTPRAAGTLAILLPAAPALALLSDDILSSDPVGRILTLSGFVLLALGIVATALGMKRLLPGYSIEPNRWGLVLAGAALSVYLWGSAQSLPALHWAAGGVLYLAAVVYLGGTYPAVTAFPVVAGALTAASGMASDLLVGIPVAVALGIFTFMFAAGPPRSDLAASACAHCVEHISKGAAFCAYCGRGLRLPAVSLGKGKVRVLAAATVALLLLAIAQPVALKSNPSGVGYATYTVMGADAQALLPALPAGWTYVNSTGSGSPSGASAAYTIDRGNTSASVLVSLIPSEYVSNQVAPANLTKISISANGSLGYGFAGNTSEAMTGFIWSSPVSYLEGSSVYSGYVTVLALEPLASFSQDSGSALLQASAALVSRLGAPVLWSIPLATVGGFLLAYQAYVVPSIGMVCVLLFVASLRGRELREGRVVDNSSGLSPQEFSLFATLARAAPLVTGEALELEAVEKNAWNQGDFCQVLGKLERLGLMSSRVRMRAGAPRLLWKCELA